MSIFWFVAGVVAGLFVPNSVSAWGKSQVKKIWNKIFKKKVDAGY